MSFRELLFLHKNNTMVVLLKTASVRVSSIQNMQVRVLRAPCLEGPLRLHRPQLQLHIFTFGRKNQREGFIAFYDTEPPPSPNLSQEG